jgi:hypothetical protein
MITVRTHVCSVCMTTNQAPVLGWRALLAMRRPSLAEPPPDAAAAAGPCFLATAAPPDSAKIGSTRCSWISTTAGG